MHSQPDSHAHTIHSRALPLLALALACTAGAARAEDATDDCLPAAHSMVQRRIVAKAGEGPEALIRFVRTSKTVYQLDLIDTVAWLDEERGKRTACLSARAARGVRAGG